MQNNNNNNDDDDDDDCDKENSNNNDVKMLEEQNYCWHKVVRRELAAHWRPDPAELQWIFADCSFH